MIQTIDIVMTATLRPAIVEQTLVSIVEKICKNNTDRFNLIINVDPAGEDILQSDIVDMARKYFPNVIYNTPEEASFSLAIKWVWGKASTPYVLHIEDDFEVLEELDIDHMIYILKKYPKVCTLRLCRGVDLDNPDPSMSGETIERGGRTWYYNKDGFYLAPCVQGSFSLNPSLMNREFQQEARLFIKEDIDPESVLRYSAYIQRHTEWHKEVYEFLSAWDYGIYAVPLAVRDIGKAWRKEHGFYKPRIGGGLPTTWIKK